MKRGKGLQAKGFSKSEMVRSKMMGRVRLEKVGVGVNQLSWIGKGVGIGMVKKTLGIALLLTLFTACSPFISDNQMYRYNLNLSIKEEVDFSIDSSPYWDLFSDLITGSYDTDSFTTKVNESTLIHPSLKPTLASKRWTMESEEITQEGYTDGGTEENPEELSYSLFDINGNYLGETSDYSEYREHQREYFGITLPEAPDQEQGSEQGDNLNSNKVELELVSTSIYKGKLVFKYYDFLDRMNILVLDIDDGGMVTDVQGL